MIIAIDGPAGCGKSTIAKFLSDHCGLYYLNSGNFYRAITLKHLRGSGDFKDRDACLASAKAARIDIIDGVFYLDGEVATEQMLHNSGVDMNASNISCIPEVRDVVNTRIRELAGTMDIISEGRDVTTVVFPDADYKFYFDARPEVRAKRRFEQNPGDASYEQVLASIIARDENDRNKPVGALKIADNAIIIDTSDLTIKQVCEKVLYAINWHKN